MIVAVDPGVSGAIALNDWTSGRLEVIPMPVQHRYIAGRKLRTVIDEGEVISTLQAFVCPEQTGKTRCCATCGACWSTTKNVAFLEH